MWLKDKMANPGSYFVVSRYLRKGGKRPVVHCYGPYKTKSSAQYASVKMKRDNRDVMTHEDSLHMSVCQSISAEYVASLNVPYVDVPNLEHNP